MSLVNLEIASTIATMRATRAGLRGPVGFVPTMGALHDGHCSLIRAAKQQCASVVVSIFVNPTQFGPNEDLAKYPRTFEADRAMLEDEGVDALFAPIAAEMYPPQAETFVDVGAIGERLDGASRPGHFRGVATVVLKLFNIVTPHAAFFGQKDAAQVAVLQAMVRDLNVPVELVICPTVRDDDGLARSSRNRYLSAKERTDALALSRALNTTHACAEAGESSAASLRECLIARLTASPNVKLEYTEIVDPQRLLPVEDISNGALVAIAAKVGNTRLIDNLVLPPRHRKVNE